MHDLNMSHYYLGNEDGLLIQDEQFGSHSSDSLAYSSKKRGKKLVGDVNKIVGAVKKRKEVGTTQNSDSGSGSTGKPV